MDDYYEVYINFGFLAVQNGADAPIKKTLDIASAVDGTLIRGFHYGDDRIEVEKTNLEIAILLLEDNKIPYRIKQHPEDIALPGAFSVPWRGLFNEAAKKNCKVPDNYEPRYKQPLFKG